MRRLYPALCIALLFAGTATLRAERFHSWESQKNDMRQLDFLIYNLSHEPSGDGPLIADMQFKGEITEFDDPKEWQYSLEISPLAYTRYRADTSNLHHAKSLKSCIKPSNMPVVYKGYRYKGTEYTRKSLEALRKEVVALATKLGSNGADTFYVNSLADPSGLQFDADINLRYSGQIVFQEFDWKNDPVAFVAHPFETRKKKRSSPHILSEIVVELVLKNVRSSHIEENIKYLLAERKRLKNKLNRQNKPETEQPEEKPKKEDADFWSGKTSEEPPRKAAAQDDFWSGSAPEKARPSSESTDTDDFWSGSDNPGKSDTWDESGAEEAFEIKMNSGLCYGVMSASGDTLIPFRDWHIYSYRNGLAEVAIYEDTHRPVTLPRTAYYRYSVNVICWKQGLVDSSGEWVLPPKDHCKVRADGWWNPKDGRDHMSEAERRRDDRMDRSRKQRIKAAGEQAKADYRARGYVVTENAPFTEDQESAAERVRARDHVPDLYLQVQD